MQEAGLRSVALQTTKCFWPRKLVFAFLLAMSNVAEADIKIGKSPYNTFLIFITGTITDRDAQALQDISNEFEYVEPIIYLDSRGGSVSAAIQIGRLIRKYDGETVIAGKCYSSCALIFIAGVVRIIRSTSDELGLHRPYLAAAPLNRQDVEKQVPLMLSTVKSYVAEMGITENFYQQMVNTEPSQMIVYKYANYTTLVPLRDPVYDEVRVAREARKYGITTSDYRQREQETKRCGIIFDDKSKTCAEALKWGLSESVYLERKAKASCSFTLEEAMGKVLPRKLDDPVKMRCEAATRKIMLGH
jgi:ATP-dependent protease ClpP protease subunit